MCEVGGRVAQAARLYLDDVHRELSYTLRAMHGGYRIRVVRSQDMTKRIT